MYAIIHWYMADTQKNTTNINYINTYGYEKNYLSVHADCI